MLPAEQGGGGFGRRWAACGDTFPGDWYLPPAPRRFRKRLEPGGCRPLALPGSVGSLEVDEHMCPWPAQDKVAAGCSGPDASGLTSEHCRVAQTSCSLLSPAASSRGLVSGHGQDSGRFGRCSREQQPGKARSGGLQRAMQLDSARGAQRQCSRILLELAYRQMHCCCAFRA